MHSHTFAMSDGPDRTVGLNATADSPAPTIRHAPAHSAWGDLSPLLDALSMDAFFRSQGEDVPDVVRFMLSDSVTGRLRPRP